MEKESASIYTILIHRPIDILPYVWQWKFCFGVLSVFIRLNGFKTKDCRNFWQYSVEFVWLILIRREHVWTLVCSEVWDSVQRTNPATEWYNRNRKTNFPLTESQIIWSKVTSKCFFCFVCRGAGEQRKCQTGAMFALGLYKVFSREKDQQHTKKKKSQKSNQTIRRKEKLGQSLTGWTKNLWSPTFQVLYSDMMQN